MSTISNALESSSQDAVSQMPKKEGSNKKTNKVATLLLRPTSYTTGCTITLQYYCADIKCKRRQQLWEQSGYHLFSKAMDRHTGQFPELVVDGTSFVLFSNGIYWLECTYTSNGFFFCFLLLAMSFVSLWIVPLFVMVGVYQMHVYFTAINDCIVEKFTEMGLVKEENGVVYLLG